MIIALLSALVGQSVPAVEVWEPRMTWGCVVSEKRKTYVVNGLIAQRNEPANLNVHYRYERALRIVRDDSGAFVGLQARWPMFVVHPVQYWAYFKGTDGLAFGPNTRSIILDKDQAGRPTAIKLFSKATPGAKPYASGRCISRVVSEEIRL